MIGGSMKPTNNGRGSGTSTWRSRKKHRKGGEKKQQRAIRKRRLRLHNPFGGRSLLARPFQSSLTRKYLFSQRCLSALASRTSVDLGNNTLFLVNDSWVFDQERSSYILVILPIRYVSDKEEKLRILDPMHFSKSIETSSSTYSMKLARTTAPKQPKGISSKTSGQEAG